MSPILFVASWLLTTFLLVSLLHQKEKCPSIWRLLGLWAAFLFPVYFFTALPLVLFNCWSVSRQMMVMIVFSGGLLFAGSHRALIDFKVASEALRKERWVLGGLFLLGGLAFFQTRHFINHLYLTHDPGAYFNLAHSVARTGRFEQQNELARLAQTDRRLEAIVGMSVQAPEEWQQTKNYGVIPKSADPSRGGFHGFFGTPLWIATGIQLFGDGALYVNWLAMAVFLVLLFSIFKELRPRDPYLSLLAVGLFVTTPLVGYVFREPLSEPLAAIAFLSLVYFGIFSSEYSVLGFFMALGVAIAMRVSTLMYLPFVVGYLFSGLAPRLSSRREWVMAGLGVAFFAVCAFASFSISPAYLKNILLFYTQVLTKKLPSGALGILGVGMLVVGVLFVLFWRRCEALLHRPKIWSSLCGLFFCALALGMAFRYGRLVTKLDHNIGGYPFVIFNFDSLLFYGSPLVVLAGFFYWFRNLYRGPNSQWYFIQLFLPFCAFFYWVYRFIPLNLQPNFQRYFLIEMIPLAVIGASLWLGEIWRGGARKMVVGVLGFTFVWNGVYAIKTNHPDISSTSLSAYQEVRDYLAGVEVSGRPAVVSLAPSWLAMAYLTPLSHGFGIATGYLHFPFSGKGRVAVRALREQGYAPLLAVETELLNGESSIQIDGEGWKKDFVWNDCYRYPKFGFAAPPTELAERCESISFLIPVASTPKQKTKAWSLAWADRKKAFPFAKSHWVGFEVDGDLLCRERQPTVFSAKLAFHFEPQFEIPEIQWNGEPIKAKVSLTGKPTSHQIEIVVDTSHVSCGRRHVLDLFFLPTRDGRKRTATVISAELRRARPGELSQTTTALR